MERAEEERKKLFLGRVMGEGGAIFMGAPLCYASERNYLGVPVSSLEGLASRL